MAIKFATVAGQSSLATTPYYTGLVQHESTMTRSETYEHLSEKLKFSQANIKAAFLALKKTLNAAAAKGCDSLADGLAHFKIYATGSVAGSNGPWVKGVNSLEIVPLEADAFRNTLDGVIPENTTEGFTPAISSVLDTVTGDYDLITGTDLVSVGGTNLAPDTTKTDEKAYVLFDDGTILPMTIVTSSLTIVTAKLAATPTKTGKAKLVIATRCGLGSEFGVKTASRVVEIA